MTPHENPPPSPPTVRVLFERALDVPADARREFVAREAGADVALRNEVLELLAADQCTSGFLEVGAQFELDSSAALVGQVVGKFTVLRPLGSGGSSSVYEARQEDLARSVALKILHAPLVEAEQLSRFQREADLLARLDHPGIVAIHDVGTLEIGGQRYPYLALELVAEAQPITTFARSRHLTIAQRLELFVAVCDAVAAGHRLGIVHRDLKPGNVLVDAGGRPRVIDFGIARVLDGEAGSAPRTMTGQLIGTPRYMSPEQLVGRPEAIDARADVWALGVLLFEVLCGILPFDVDGLPVAGIARTVLEREPKRLSRLQPECRGDLEVIVDHALSTDPQARYRDAGELGTELARFLAGRPIEARRDHRLYVLRKRIVRHRVLLAATSLVGLLSVASAIGFGWLWQRTEDAHERSERNVYDSRIALAANAFETDRYGDARRELEACPPRFRDWEWWHLMARTDDSLWAVQLPNPPLRSLATPGRNASLLVVGDEAGRAWLLNAADGTRCPQDFGHTRAVTCAAFLRGDRVLATGSWDRTVALWNVETGERLATLPHPEEVWTLVAAADGSWFATGDRAGTLRVWDAPTLALRHTVQGHVGGVTALAAAWRSPMLASGGQDCRIALWDSTTGTLVRRITESMHSTSRGVRSVSAHGAVVHGLAFHVSDEFLFSSSNDGFGKMWHVADGELRFYEALGRELGSIDVSHDGQLLAIAATDSVLLRDAVDARRGEPLRADGGVVNAAVFSPDGARVFTIDDTGGVRCFDTRRRSGVYDFGRHAGESYASGLSGDGRWLVMADDRGELQVFDTRTLEHVRTLQQDRHRIRSVLPDRTGDTAIVTSDDRKIRRIDLSTGAELAAADAPGRPYAAAAGDEAYVFGDAPELRIVDRASLAWHATLACPDGPIFRAIAEPSGHQLVAGTRSGVLLVWDLSSRTLVRRWPAHEGAIWCMAFWGPDTLVSGGGDRRLRCWSWPRGVLTREFPPLAGPVVAVERLPSGRRLLVCLMRDDPRIIDLTTGSTLLQLTGHEPGAIFRELQAIGEGRYVTADSLGKLRVWSDRPLRPR